MKENEIRTRMRTSTIHIDNRERITLSTVIQVDSFNDIEICVVTDEGMLRIEGEQLHISRLNIDDGEMVIEGLFCAMEYAAEHSSQGGFFSKFFR